MRIKLFVTVALLLAIGAFGAPRTADAAPLFQYNFKVLNYECRAGSTAEGCEAETNFFIPKLNSLSVNLIGFGPWSLDYIGCFLCDPNPRRLENSGFASVDVSGWNRNIDLGTGSCTPDPTCSLVAIFSGFLLLSGQYVLQTTNDTVSMTSTGLLWNGTIRSDGPFLTSTGQIPEFTGVWGLTAVISEPSTLALMMLAIAMLAISGRRVARSR